MNEMESNDHLRLTATEMDEDRQRSIAYQYLCHLEEAKIWMEAVLKEQLPPVMEIEESLRNGVYLARLGNLVSPTVVPMSRIYDVFQHKYKAAGLQFRHTDNIHYWIKSLHKIALPKTFHPETTDVYDKKNMPRVIYCIHALSTHLFSLGKAPQIQELYGRVTFSSQDINQVCEELKKCGVTIPAFQKIGGLLAGDLDSNSATIHAAIIQINAAIDKGDVLKLDSSLNNPGSGLDNVISEYMKEYLAVLREVKTIKCKLFAEKSLDDSYEADIYDEYLVQAEIQGYIRKINAELLFHKIEDAVIEGNRKDLTAVLLSAQKDLKEFIPDNMDVYINNLMKLKHVHSFEEKMHSIEYIIKTSNQAAKEALQVNQVLSSIRNILDVGTPDELILALRNPVLRLAAELDEFAAPLYFEEMKIDLQDTETLKLEDINSSVKILNTIAQITSAVDCGDFDMTWQGLKQPAAYFMNLNPALKTNYLTTLSEARQQKLSLGVLNPVLTYSDIQVCIDLANSQEDQQERILRLIEQINEAVRCSDYEDLVESLSCLAPDEITDTDVPLCMQLLQRDLKAKEGVGENLWLENIISVVQDAQLYNHKASKVRDWLIEINSAVINDEDKNVLKALEQKYIIPNDSTMLLNSLKDIRRKKENLHQSPWVVCNCDEVPLYLNMKNKTYQWTKPNGINGSSYFLSVSDIENLVNQFNRILNQTNSVALQDDFNHAEHLIVLLQAHARGFLVRQRVKRICSCVIKIQAWWRGVIVRRAYARLSHQKQPTFNYSYYQPHINQIIKIQALWRGYQSRKMLSKLNKHPNLTLSLLRRMVPHLRSVQTEYSIDLQIQTMKSKVVQIMKQNQELGRQLDEMDTKIGLLIQNRVTLQAVVAEGKKLSAAVESSAKGIRTLTKDVKYVLDGYQRLFYQLQTKPEYISRLLVHLPSTNRKVLLQNCVLALFNYGSSPRDSYLILQLFHAALNEEFQCKFQKPMDTVTDNSLVLKLALGYAREAGGENALKDILGPVVEKVLNDKNLCIDTNPVDVYRRWINQLETESGKSTELPHTVTQEQALKYPEVVRRLNLSINSLKTYVRYFLERLSLCSDKLPYSLRFVVKSLHDALQEKFPHSPEKENLKIVGHFLYYQYINSSIIAPEAFHIITLPPDKLLRPEQRRNLASIARILQFSATKKGFGDESCHLMALNPFIIECHEEMKKFCKNCCTINNLNEYFRITKYSDAELTEKPRVYMSLHEILECHKLFLDHRNILAPDALDPIHEALDDIGPLSNVYSLLGWSSDDLSETRAKNTEVYLELDNQLEQLCDDPLERQLFTRTKEIILSRLDKLQGDSLVLAVQEPQHRDIAKLLDELENTGMVTSRDGYKSIIQSIADDISRKETMRQAQNKEIQLLRTVLHRLSKKKRLYEEKVAYYEEYIQTCLKNMTAHKSIGRKTKQHQHRTIKYSGARLNDKGILLAVDGVRQGHLKNIQFEISNTEINGLFSVTGKFMGVEVEKVAIDIQDLLRLQYEGRSVMDLFGKAQINVNLLLYLLNKKFCT